MTTSAQLDDVRESAAGYPSEAARKPDFFIVGAAKCGTTTLYAHLKGHPEVFMPDLKEPDFFGDDLFQLTGDERSYLDLFAAAGPDVLAGEASALYLYSEVAAEKIR